MYAVIFYSKLIIQDKTHIRKKVGGFSLLLALYRCLCNVFLPINTIMTIDVG